MKCNITKTTPPSISNLVITPECITFLPPQASLYMQQSIVPMLFSPLGAHTSVAEFQNPDLSCKKTSGMLADIVAESSSGKGQLSVLSEALCRNIHKHGNEEHIRNKSPKHLVSSNNHRRYGLRAVPLCHVVKYSIQANIRQQNQGPTTIRRGMVVVRFGDRTSYKNALYLQSW